MKNIHGHIQSAVDKYELHHNIKKDIQIQTLTTFRLQMSDHVQIVDLGNCGYNEQHRADEPLSKTDGWMSVHN